MSWLTGSSEKSAAARRLQEIATRVQGRKERKQEKLASKTLAGLLSTQKEEAPVINLPELPPTPRLPGMTDKTVIAAAKRRRKRNTGGRTGSGSTGLVNRLA